MSKVPKPGSLDEKIAKYLSDPVEFPLEYTAWLRSFLSEPTNYNSSAGSNAITKITSTNSTITITRAGTVDNIAVTKPVITGSSQQLAADVNTALPNNQANQRVKVGSTFGASLLDLSNNADPKWLVSGKYSVMAMFGTDPGFPFAVGSYYLYFMQTDNAGFNAVGANTFPAHANNQIPSATCTAVGDVVAGDSLYLLAGQRPAGAGTPPQVNVQISINRIA